MEQADGSITTQSKFGGGTGAAWYLLETKRSIKPIIFQKRRNYTLVRQDKEGDDNVFNRASFVYGSDAPVGAGYGLWQQAYASKSALDCFFDWLSFAHGRVAGTLAPECPGAPP